MVEGVRARYSGAPGMQTVPMRGSAAASLGKRPNIKGRMATGEGIRVDWPDSSQNPDDCLLKRQDSLCRPTLPESTAWRSSRAFRSGLLGRSQAVRQWILIPPFGGSIPPAPASHSGVDPGSPGKARMGRKCRLFAPSIPFPDPWFADMVAAIGKSLRLRPRIFPVSRESAWRQVRSALRRQPKFVAAKRSNSEKLRGISIAYGATFVHKNFRLFSMPPKVCRRLHATWLKRRLSQMRFPRRSCLCFGKVRAVKSSTDI